MYWGFRLKESKHISNLLAAVVCSVLLFLAVAETVGGEDCEESQEEGDQQNDTNCDGLVVENCLEGIEAIGGRWSLGDILEVVESAHGADTIARELRLQAADEILHAIADSVDWLLILGVLAQVGHWVGVLEVSVAVPEVVIAGVAGGLILSNNWLVVDSVLERVRKNIAAALGSIVVVENSAVV